MAATVTAFEHQALRIGSGAQSLTQADVRRLLQVSAQRPGLCTLGHAHVRLAQYAGLVALDGRVLEILPKVGEEADAARSRGTLLRLLRLAHDLPLESAGTAAQSLQRQSLLEVFIAAFLGEVARLVRGGLARRYCTLEDDLSLLRGRLQIARQATRLAMRPDRLACRFDALTPDHACNRTLKTALHVLRPWIGDVALARQWLELNLAFDEVGTLPAGAPPPSVPRERDLRRYAAALTWARWILELLSPSLRAGAEVAPALLFDMNRLFEQAVATHLRRRAHRRGLHLRTQDTGHHLAHSADASARAHFGLRPDLVLANDHGVVCVADTKWCRLDIDAHGRCSPASSHLYQLNAYASVYACGELALIYPYQGSPRNQGGDAYHLPPRGGARPLLQVVCLDVSREGLPWVGDAAPTALAGVLRDGPSTP